MWMLDRRHLRAAASSISLEEQSQSMEVMVENENVYLWSRWDKRTIFFSEIIAISSFLNIATGTIRPLSLMDYLHSCVSVCRILTEEQNTKSNEIKHEELCDYLNRYGARGDVRNRQILRYARCALGLLLEEKNLEVFVEVHDELEEMGIHLGTMHMSSSALEHMSEEYFRVAMYSARERLTSGNAALGEYCHGFFLGVVELCDFAKKIADKKNQLGEVLNSFFKIGLTRFRCKI